MTDVRPSDITAGRADADVIDLDERRNDEPAPFTIDTIRAGLLAPSDLDKLPDPEPMVGNYLDRGMVAAMPGKYGSLKSFAALSMCCSVATGEQWLGQRIHHIGPAVYLSLEGAYTLKDRVRGWLHHHNRHAAELDERLHIWPDGLSLTDPEQMDAWLEFLAELEPALVVIDTLSKASRNLDQHRELGFAHDALARMRDASGASILTVSHTGHSVTGRTRGDSTFEDDLDVVLSMEGQWKDGAVKLESQKQKARENPPPFWVRLDITPNGDPVATVAAPPKQTETERASSLRRKVLVTVAENPRCTVRSLTSTLKGQAEADGTTSHRSSVITDEVERCETEGLVVVHRGGSGHHHEVTEAGRKWLADEDANA